MPLVLKANNQRVYPRTANGAAHTQLYGVLDWQHIKDRSENSNLFTFSYPIPCFANGDRYIPGIRDEIIIYRNDEDATSDTRWFAGLITSVSDEMIQTYTGYTPRYRFECASYDILLDKELRQPQKANLTWEALLIFLLQTHFSGQLSSDYSLISNPIAAPPIRINNGNIRTLLQAMRQLTGHDYYVDNYKRLNVFQATDMPGSFRFTDTPSIGFPVYDSRPTITHDARGLYNLVRQPFQSQVGINDWPGETFTAKGDPKGQGGGQFPLLRTPTEIDTTTYLDERFDNIQTDIWSELDDTGTHHPDYPNQGYLFAANGQLQVLGGTAILGEVSLRTQAFFQEVESAYVVQELQLTTVTGSGYICLFGVDNLLSVPEFKAGLQVLENQLLALDGTVLVSALGTTVNYLLWVTMLPDGWQYDIQGGIYATKQTIRTETGITHQTDYRLSPIVNVDMHCSINSFRYRKSDRGVLLRVNDETKVVGLESSDTDLPDIDAFLNVDETPALIKFRAASALAVIASVASDTVFNVATGQGVKFLPGHRILVGSNVIEEFHGKAGIVASVATDTITLFSPGIAGLVPSQQILVNTTVPAEGDKIEIHYAYAKGDEATAYDQKSIDKYGSLPVALDEKDHIKRFDDAQMEAESYLARYSDGILTINFTSNDKLIPVDPSPMTAIPVTLTSRPDPIAKTLILQRIEIAPLDAGGKHLRYNLVLESADPVRPFEDAFTKKSLNIGSDGEIRFTLNLTEQAVSDVELFIERIDSAYITWANPAQRKWGTFRWKPDEVIPTPGGGTPVGLLLAITQPGSVEVVVPGGTPIGLLLAITKAPSTVTPPTPQARQPYGLLLAITNPIDS